MEHNRNEGSVAIDDAVETLQPPSNYKVILLNDDYTTKDFVVYVLEYIFQKTEAEATAIMESVHKSGKGIAGIYSYDIAASKAQKTVKLARANEFPLNCTVERC